MECSVSIEYPPSPKSCKEYCLFIDKNRSYFVYLAYTMTNNFQDAEDLVQDLCVRLHSVENIPTVEHPKSWIRRVLRNMFIDDCRKGSRKILNRSVEEIYADSCEHRCASKDYETDSLYSKVMVTLVGQMKEMHREVIVLCYLEGYSVESVSNMLDIPIGTVKSRLSRGKGKLRKILKDFI